MPPRVPVVERVGSIRDAFGFVHTTCAPDLCCAGVDAARVRSGDSLRCFRRLCAVLAVSVVAGPALAQEESFNPGTVWNFSYIKVEPGQMNRYMDYLARWESARATSSLITCSR